MKVFLSCCCSTRWRTCSALFLLFCCAAIPTPLFLADAFSTTTAPWRSAAFVHSSAVLLQRNPELQRLSCKPLREILEELDEKDIRYPPLASRDELENLLRRSKSQLLDQQEMIQDETSSSSSSSFQQQKQQQQQSPPADTTFQQKKQPKPRRKTLPLQLLLQKLDAANIRYPPTASRQELEDIWKRHLSMSQRETKQQTYENQPHKDSSSSSSKTKKQRAPKTLWNRVLRKSQSTLQTKATRTVQQAARSARKVADFVTTDDDDDSDNNDNNNIRDVEFQYLHKEETPVSPTASYTIDVQAVPIPNSKTRKVKREHEQDTYRDSYERKRKRSPSQPWQQPRYRSYSTLYDDKSGHKRSRPTRSRRPVPSATQQPRHQQQHRQQQPPTNNSLPQLPEASVASRRKRRADQEQSRRRVYSPYAEERPGDAYFNDRDAFDRVGEFLVDTADRILWGKYDDDDQDAEAVPREASPDMADSNVSRQKKTKREPNTGHSSSSNPRKRHWKDRMEQRLDLMMGIHHKDEDGYYERWSEKQQQQQRVGCPVKKNGKPFYDKPVWQDEGNFVSLLLGRQRNGRPLAFQNVLDRENGSLLFVFQYTFKSILLLGGYISRWASVRGAIPQPLVVLGLVTSGICAPRHRLRSMILALILLRTTGELVHGSLYGNEGWDDDNGEQNEDEQPDRIPRE